MIREGRVRVNGKVVTELGTKADPIRDDIRVGTKRVGFAAPRSTWIFHKPVGVVCTRSDEEDRPTVFHYIPKKLHKLGLTNVGRLDMDTHGLLLMTNDGELAYRLMRPEFHVPKVYEVKIRGHMSPTELSRFKKGVYIPGLGRTQPASATVMSELDNASWIRVELMEGKNRQIRRMCEALGHQVSKLCRVAVGPVLLGGLKPGEMRELTPAESERLYKLVSLQS